MDEQEKKKIFDYNTSCMNVVEYVNNDIHNPYLILLFYKLKNIDFHLNTIIQKFKLFFANNNYFINNIDFL